MAACSPRCATPPAPGATTTTFDTPLRPASGSIAVAVASADFDNDGRIDLAAGNSGTTGPGGIAIFTIQTTQAAPPPT